ncbi:hypothetical protein BH11ARM2_BH11ARM2_28340 [soil metagenome]
MYVWGQGKVSGHHNRGVKRAWPGWLTVVLCGLALWLTRATSPDLLRDSDTAVLLTAIRQRHAPLSWFAGDWPLQNHFYRPVSTLTFEMDNALWGNSAAGYAGTNAILAILCVAALYWFLRELTDRTPFAIAGTLLFTSWVLGYGDWLAGWVAISGWVVLGVGVWRNGLSVKRYLPAALAIGYLAWEVSGLHPLYGRVIAWLPGRTASTMTVFCLMAMASYARYERLGARRRHRHEHGPLDPPATRSTTSFVLKERKAWAVLAVVSTALALASYEQAVMLPACLLGVAISLRWQGKKTRWAWQAAFWGVLVGYLVLRYQVVPHTVSGYQRQQYRTGMGAIQDLGTYAFAPISTLLALVNGLSVGLIILFTAQPWFQMLEIARGVAAVRVAARDWRWPLTGWCLSLLAFLPMAFLKIFEHYHWWPMALRTILVVGLAQAVGRSIVIAWSRPERQAPPRPDPAPGSLPRP